MTGMQFIFVIVIQGTKQKLGVSRTGVLTVSRVSVQITALTFSLLLACLNAFIHNTVIYSFMWY